ncbi:hypothetical protein INT45_008229 [Circinella minor]|uniref:Uncharacterized protein n=1 Tax=Circinella minor TaxID=1195481 RepID=A0A8H7VNK4_9FUNG|nr:hypothetical protein INT45_008229 [Circinella minor]
MIRHDKSNNWIELYWATCLWSYAQKIYTVGKQADRALARGPPLAPPPVPMMPPPPGTVHHPPIPSMMNLKPKIMVLDDGSTKYEMSPEDSSITIQQYNEKEQRGYQHTHQQLYDDGQKSAAQIARIFFKKLKHVYKNNR